MKSFEKIEKLRTDNGLSQQDLADKVFVSRQAVQKWEKGKSQPSIDVLKKLSKLFNVTIDYLIIDDESEIEKPNKDAEPEKTEEINENTPEISDKKKKRLGVKIALGILIPAVVIGGGVLAFKLIKDSQQKKYGEEFGTVVTNDDFDIRTQIIPDVNNVAVQIVPKYDIKNIDYSVSIYSNMLSHYSDRQTYSSWEKGKIVTFEYPFQKISSVLGKDGPQNVIVSINGKKQNKNKTEEVPTNDYSGISGYATYDSSVTINGAVPYLTSYYDGLIFAGSDLKIVYKNESATLTISKASFKTDEMNYLRKGSTLQITGKYNSELSSPSKIEGKLRFEFDHIESGKIYYGPKVGEGTINLERNDRILDYVGFEEFSDGTNILKFSSLVDISGFLGLEIFVMDKTYSDTVVKTYADLGNFKNLNIQACDECFLTTALPSDVVSYLKQGYPAKFKGLLKTPFEINHQCNIIIQDVISGTSENYRRNAVLPGYPIPVPITHEFPKASIRGYYEDEFLTRLVDFSSAAEDEYIDLFAKVK